MKKSSKDKQSLHPGQGWCVHDKHLSSDGHSLSYIHNSGKVDPEHLEHRSLKPLRSEDQSIRYIDIGKLRPMPSSWPGWWVGCGLSVALPSGIRQIKQVLLRRRPTLVPSARAIVALDAGVLPGLFPAQTVVQHPVCPQALVVSGRGAGHCVARSNLRDRAWTTVNSQSGFGNGWLM